VDFDSAIVIPTGTARLLKDGINKLARASGAKGCGVITRKSTVPEYSNAFDLAARNPRDMQEIQSLVSTIYDRATWHPDFEFLKYAWSHIAGKSSSSSGGGAWGRSLGHLRRGAHILKRGLGRVSESARDDSPPVKIRRVVSLPEDAKAHWRERIHGKSWSHVPEMRARQDADGWARRSAASTAPPPNAGRSAVSGGVAAGGGGGGGGVSAPAPFIQQMLRNASGVGSSGGGMEGGNAVSIDPDAITNANYEQYSQMTKDNPRKRTVLSTEVARFLKPGGAGDVYKQTLKNHVNKGSAHGIRLAKWYLGQPGRSDYKNLTTNAARNRYAKEHFDEVFRMMATDAMDVTLSSSSFFGAGPRDQCVIEHIEKFMKEGQGTSSPSTGWWAQILSRAKGFWGG
jgi:hypothetical protein